METRIAELEKQIETERLVNEKIKRHVQKKTDSLNNKADERDKMREKKVEDLLK